MSKNSQYQQEQKSNTMIKVLREMSIQTSKNYTMAEFDGGCSSFLDKSDMQV